MQLQVLAGLQRDGLDAVSERAGADLRALGVEHHGDVLALALDGALGARLADAIRDRAVVGVVAVGEVQPGHVHAGVHHLQQHLGAPARRADGAHDLRLADGLVGVRGHDVAKATRQKKAGVAQQSGMVA